MNKKEWLKYTDKLISGTDRTALHDYFMNRHYEVMVTLGELLEGDDIRKGLDYMNDLVSRLSAYETFLLRLNKIELLKDSSNSKISEATDKDIEMLIKYSIHKMLKHSKAFDKYKHDPHGLDDN